MWREPPGPTTAGALALGPSSLRLDGVSDAGRVVLEVRYADLERVRMAAGREERLDGRPTLLLEVKPARRVQMAAVAGLGVLREVADVLVLAMAGL